MKRCRLLVLIIILCGALLATAAGQINFGTDPRIDYARGQAFLKTKNYEAALQSFRKAVEGDPNYIEAIKALANTARTIKDRMDPKLRPSFSVMLAVRVFYAAKAAAEPKNATYQWALGLFDDSQTEQEAERCYRQAISLDANFPEAYQSLASTLLYRGNVAEARVMLRKAYELSPNDPEAVAAYALRLGDENATLFAAITTDFLRRFAGHAAGADLISRTAANESDLEMRIAALEKLKALYPPSENEVSEWYMKFLFDAYLRTNITHALPLAQEMSRLMPVRSVAKMDWEYCTDYVQSLMEARRQLEKKAYGPALETLSQVAPPPLVSPDPQTLLRAEATAIAGKAGRAYEILVSAMAAQPSEALKAAFTRYSTKSLAQVDEDVWNARLKKASKARSLELLSLRDGKLIRLEEFRGRAVLVYFWYPGDRVSRDEFPYLQRILDKYGPQGLTVITINIRPEEDTIAGIVMGHYSFVALRVPDDNWAAKNYRVDRVPSSMLIEPQGRVLFRPEFWGYDPRHAFELELADVLGRAQKDRFAP